MQVQKREAQRLFSEALAEKIKLDALLKAVNDQPSMSKVVNLHNKISEIQLANMNLCRQLDHERLRTKFMNESIGKNSVVIYAFKSLEQIKK